MKRADVESGLSDEGIHVAWSRAVPHERWRHLHKEVASHGVSGPQQGEGSMARCGGVRAWGSEKGIGGGGEVSWEEHPPTPAFG